MDLRRLQHEDYRVGWVCVGDNAIKAANAMLDEYHQDLPLSSPDSNYYSLGRIGAHNVVIVCLPQDASGIIAAAVAATRMSFTFASIRYRLMVGIGGDVPSDDHDIRLGDVVVSNEIVHWDRGRIQPGGFSRTGSLSKPPGELVTAVSKLRSAHDIAISGLLSQAITGNHKLPERFRDPPGERDVLFEATCKHAYDSACVSCDLAQSIPRPPRLSDQTPLVHYGLIASGSGLVRDGYTRDRLSDELRNLLCFDMESAGLMNNFPCIVIRGIYCYANSHASDKNTQFREYSEATAAAYAKKLLSFVPPDPAVYKWLMEEGQLHEVGKLVEFSFYFIKPCKLKCAKRLCC
jgi:nucleoside phosphorylase